jgi:hypothetical protein
MIEKIYPLSFRRYRELPVFGSILDDYVKWAWERGHTYYTIKAQLCACVSISEFMLGKGVKSWAEIPYNIFDAAYQKFFESNHSSVAGSTDVCHQVIISQYQMQVLKLAEVKNPTCLEKTVWWGKKNCFHCCDI